MISGNEKADMGLSGAYILKRFFANSNSNSNSVSDLYDRQQELTIKKNYEEASESEIQELESINDAITIISNINKQIKSIRSDADLSSSEKGKQIKELQQQRTDTARQALNKNLINEENASKIESTKFYPTSSNLKYNGYTLTLTEEMKKEYETLAYEKYKQYASQGLYNETYLEKIETICKDYAKKTLIQKYKSQLEISK